MKYLITGLGNIGSEYEETRHNIGFDVLDALAKEFDVKFTTDRYASVAECKYKSRTLILIKPSTYMNLSGKALKYWMDKEKIELANNLVIVDDLALDLGQIRIKAGGSDGGHNGLSHIAEVLETNKYPRLRFGIGKDFAKGFQVEYVLSRFSSEERKLIEPRVDLACEMIKSFCFIGLEQTQNAFNNK